MKTKEKESLLMSVIVILSFIILSFILGMSLRDSSKENYLLKTILITDTSFSEVSIDSQIAEQYYAEAGFAYEKGDYNSVETNCRLAREYYLQESQGYKRIKAELKAKEIEDNLIYIYVDILESQIEATNNMYEACEYFESAARHYDLYYNTNVPYNDPNYDMGTFAIRAMNEKIRNRDEAVERYNNLLEEFGLELESRIK